MAHGKNYGALACCLALAVLAGVGCVPPRSFSPPPAGVVMQPGSYLTEYYVAPEFDPTQGACHLGPFTVEQTHGVAPDVFLPIFQAELTRAWEANGLKTAAQAPESGCALTGVLNLVSIRGESLRFLQGSISGQLMVSGTITRAGRVVFAFRDRISEDSPVNPGPQAPKEKELLLRQICRSFAHRLLDELLLHGLTPEGR
jgi:hypothetical protein